MMAEIYKLRLDLVAFRTCLWAFYVKDSQFCYYVAVGSDPWMIPSLEKYAFSFYLYRTVQYFGEVKKEKERASLSLSIHR